MVSAVWACSGWSLTTWSLTSTWYENTNSQYGHWWVTGASLMCSWSRPLGPLGRAEGPYDAVPLRRAGVTMSATEAVVREGSRQGHSSRRDQRWTFAPR